MIRSYTLIAAAAAIATGQAAQAAVFDFTFTDTISSASTPGINVGDTFTVHLFADNGGSSAANQTWNLADLQGFTIHAGTYSASYSTVFESPATGNFQTDAAGVVTSVQFFGTSNSSNNTDNFGSWTADTVFGDASFLDYLGRGNTIAASTFTNADQWTVGLAGTVPEPASWALMLIGFGAAGSALRGRRGLAAAA